MVRGFFKRNFKVYTGLGLFAVLCLFAVIQVMPVSAQDDDYQLQMFSDDAYPDAVEDESVEEGGALKAPIPEDRNFGGGFEHDLLIKTEDGRRYNFTVELALTPSQQAKGLMFREEMPEMHGMLFVFGSEHVRSFWMKDTLIPLDIIFVEKTGRIQHIHSMAKPLDESLISSGKPSYAVLEINGGMADRLELSAGDYIFHEAFRNTNLE